MINQDNLDIVSDALQNEMPHIVRGVGDVGHNVKWNIGRTNPDKMPDNIVYHEVNANEKFLNKYQSIIEDTLTQKQLKQFVEYQNWNFQHGMGELTEIPIKEYRDSTDHWKEGLFNSCECKEKRQLEKVVIESMGVDNFGVFPHSWTSLIPQHTNFSYQTLVTFSNPSVNRAGCEPAPNGQIGHYGNDKFERGTNQIYWAIYGSNISYGGVQPNQLFNWQDVKWNGSGSGTNFHCMYDDSGNRVGTGTNYYSMGSGEGFYELDDINDSGFGELCTGTATIRGGIACPASNTSPSDSFQRYGTNTQILGAHEGGSWSGTAMTDPMTNSQNGYESWTPMFRFNYVTS